VYEAQHLYVRGMYQMSGPWNLL